MKKENSKIGETPITINLNNQIDNANEIYDQLNEAMH